jgi:dihydroorotate dehydrogenase (fumarate)
VRLLVAVKIGPSLTALASMAVWRSAPVPTGWCCSTFWQPDIDLATLLVQLRLRVSTSDELPVPLRWTAILHGRVRASLALSTGVRSGADAAKALLAGADVAMLASALLLHGPEHLRTVERQLVACPRGCGIASLDRARGMLSQRDVPDTSVFERANDLETLASHARRR